MGLYALTCHLLVAAGGPGVVGDCVASKWQAGAGFAGTTESRGGAFVVTSLASSRNLLANPFNCNCQLAWLGDWLRRRKIVTGNPRCQNPDFLRQIPLQDVASPDFRCEEGNAWAPPPTGWSGDRAWSCPREEGSPGEGRGEEHGHPLSPAPASAWWGLRCDCKNNGGRAVFKKWGNTDKGRA